MELYITPNLLGFLFTSVKPILCSAIYRVKKPIYKWIRGPPCTSVLGETCWFYFCCWPLLHKLPMYIPSLKLTARPWKSPSFLVLSKWWMFHGFVSLRPALVVCPIMCRLFFWDGENHRNFQCFVTFFHSWLLGLSASNSGVEWRELRKG